ncbi:hypothetical protein EZS27_013304 [termite gut metagenome]|jgi:hypothetical protein|uniref:Uncharacterized protein n=1 Tax=termite gut metagenome TaxID=433724 RepID=A0A5J4RZ90_9ZZZZ
MKTSVWLTYDLGVKGDYKGLYAWLDDHEAIECGNNLAYFKYEFNDNDSFENNLRKDLERKVTFEPGNRIYVVRVKNIDGQKKTIGSFLIGKRKASSWEGYGEKVDDTKEIE